MFKAIGLIGLIAASGLLGVLKTLSLKERVRLLDDYLKTLLQLKSRINYFKEPLLNIFKDISTEKNDLSKSYILLHKIGSELNLTDRDILSIWKDSVCSVYDKSPLTSTDIGILQLPGSYIGQTDFENQQAQFYYTEERLKEQINQAKEDYKIKGRLYNRIGFFIGGIIAIILI